MELSNIKINYLYNSGFAVETENYFLIFDYYLDTEDKNQKNIKNGFIGVEELSTDKNVIVFSSHSHEDHFNPVILTWKQLNNNIKYIFSSDIKSQNADYIYYMSPYDTLNLEGVKISAFDSTDLGGSFLVNVDGISIFHSGDLNWWDWSDVEKEYSTEMEEAFKNEISKIKLNNVDIAFFPVDPRLKKKYCSGGEYFIKEVAPKAFIPMHFGTNYEITDKFANDFKALPCRIKTIHKRGEEIHF